MKFIFMEMLVKTEADSCQQDISYRNSVTDIQLTQFRTRHLIVLPSKAYSFSCKVISCLFNYFKDVMPFIRGT